MANRNTHIAAGAAAGSITVLVMQMLEGIGNPNHKINWGLVALGGAAGGFAGALPDMIEPATNPRHRQFFHSIVAGYLVYRATCGKHTELLEIIDQQLLAAFGSGYLSHLALDAVTPASIRLI